MSNIGPAYLSEPLDFETEGGDPYLAMTFRDIIEGEIRLAFPVSEMGLKEVCAVCGQAEDWEGNPAEIWTVTFEGGSELMDEDTGCGDPIPVHINKFCLTTFVLKEVTNLLGVPGNWK